MKTTKILAIVAAVVVLVAALGAGGWFWYDSSVDRSGWNEREGQKQYLDFHGDPVTGWQEIEGKRYYFGTDGAMVAGTAEIGGKTYYFAEDGIFTTGWARIGTETRYLDEYGSAVSGWLDLDGKRYYLPEGILVTGWQEIEGKRYYFAEDGAMATGTLELDGQRYALREDGSLLCGWENGHYYLNDGSLATGWQEIDGKRYCFDDQGTPITGWKQEGEYRYYLTEDGSAAVGPYEIDGYTYHFTPKGIQIWLVNGKHLIPDFYTCETVLTAGGVHLDKSCADAFARMFNDCKAAGNTPDGRVGYRSYWDQLAIMQDTIDNVGHGGLLYVAMPNASEHQLGLAVDVPDSSIRILNDTQKFTGTYKWLHEHCWEYGFIVRYPDDPDTLAITGVGFEPWHYRYVGVEVAMEMKELGITLEEYLGAV